MCVCVCAESLVPDVFFPLSTPCHCSPVFWSFSLSLYLPPSLVNNEWVVKEESCFLSHTHCRFKPTTCTFGVWPWRETPSLFVCFFALSFACPPLHPVCVSTNTLIHVSCMSLIIHWHPPYTQTHTHTHTHTSHTHPPCLSVHVCFKGWIQWGLTGIQIDLLSLKQLFFFFPPSIGVCALSVFQFTSVSQDRNCTCVILFVCASISAAS